MPTISPLFSFTDIAPVDAAAVVVVVGVASEKAGGVVDFSIEEVQFFGGLVLVAIGQINEPALFISHFQISNTGNDKNGDTLSIFGTIWIRTGDREK